MRELTRIAPQMYGRLGVAHRLDDGLLYELSIYLLVEKYVGYDARKIIVFHAAQQIIARIHTLKFGVWIAVDYIEIFPIV